MIKLLDTIHTFGRDYHPLLTLFLANTIYVCCTPLLVYYIEEVD